MFQFINISLIYNHSFIASFLCAVWVIYQIVFIYQMTINSYIFQIPLFIPEKTSMIMKKILEIFMRHEPLQSHSPWLVSCKMCELCYLPRSWKAGFSPTSFSIAVSTNTSGTLWQVSSNYIHIIIPITQFSLYPPLPKSITVMFSCLFLPVNKK